MTNLKMYSLRPDLGHISLCMIHVHVHVYRILANRSIYNVATIQAHGSNCIIISITSQPYFLRARMRARRYGWLARLLYQVAQCDIIHHTNAYVL